jgi:phosphatidylinositol alpha-1,6-mannosyltransferase
MRLLFLSSEFPPGPGGIGTHAHQLARRLTVMGWEVVMVTPQSYTSKDEVESFNRLQPFNVVSLRQLPFAPVKAVYRWVVASRLIGKWRPQVILASGDREVYLGARLARHYRLPWVAVEHGRIPPRWERPLKRRSFREANAVVCVSRYTAQKLLDLGVNPRHLRVIPNGADIKRLSESDERDHSVLLETMGLSGKRILLTVGSVTDRKGQDVVIRALPRVLQRMPNTHYLMAGLPAKQKEFTKIAEELGVAGHVHFLGHVDNRTLSDLFNSCDLFIMTSRHTADEFEGFGIASVEAALCGKPSIVSMNSGLAEAIVDGETGLGVPEEDEAATADKVLSLLEDEGRRQTMGNAARLHALTEQTWEKRAAEYDSLFRDILRAADLPSGYGTHEKAAARS